MIIKFPYMPNEYLEPLVQWLESQKHEYMSEHHKLAAYHNDEEATKHKYIAGAFEYIMLMITWHMKEKG